MPRRRFGGGIADWAFTVGTGNVPLLSAAAVCKFYSASAGGSQLTDLAAAADGSGPMTQVLSLTGAQVGQLPTLFGPADGTAAMWLEANGGPRVLIVANDIAASTAFLNGAQTWSASQTFGPYGDVNASRLTVFAEAVGQVADTMTFWSGTDTGQGSARQRTSYFNEKGEFRCICAKTNSVGVRIKGQPGQTAHVLEQTDTSNNPISWWDPDGSWRAPNIGSSVFRWERAGNLAVATTSFKIYNDTGVTLTLRATRFSVNTAPTGAAAKFDVFIGGATVFTTTANKPQIAIGALTAKNTNMDVVAWPDGQALTYSITQVGSTVAGADLSVQILAY
jgi:hypothetical protein